MKTFFRAVLVLALAVPAFAENWDARLGDVSGDVSVQPADGSPEVSGEADMPLEEGDRVVVGEGGSAEVALDGGSLITVREKSDLKIEKSDKADSSFFLAAGSLLAKIQKLGTQRFRVRTTSAVAAVRGTEFGVEVDGEDSHVGVFDEGKVEVTGAAGGTPELLISNQETSVAKGAAPSTPSRSSASPPGARRCAATAAVSRPSRRAGRRCPGAPPGTAQEGSRAHARAPQGRPREAPGRARERRARSPREGRPRPAAPPGDAAQDGRAARQGEEGAPVSRAAEKPKAPAPAPAADPTTLSGIPVKREYGPEDLPPAEAIGAPGRFPFTRGLKSGGYRMTPWTMRMFAGHKTAKDTNERFKYLLAHGQTGLSTAFDLPTLMGLDSDDPRSLGEVGREGVAVDSLADMEILFSGIDLGKVSTSMTINLPAPVILAMYLALAKKQGVPLTRVRGTCQTDILKEYIAQNEYLYPPEPSMRLVLDLIEHCVREVPRFYPISISGYHIREAGADAVQELAFTLADGRDYAERLIARGLNVDDFAPSSRSSSTCTITSSRRSPSCAPRARSGRSSCATSSAPRRRCRGCCRCTARRRASA
ncbi:MAG: methylmalonyl-CoA mutase family protein [Elusimicrobiota bacterium]|nr:MAG: methylmalonyl-CoA mutase family protein [Elusimicrobiota bacterium]